MPTCPRGLPVKASSAGFEPADVWPGLGGDLQPAATAGAGFVTVCLQGPDTPATRITADHNGGVTLAPAERRLLARMPLHAITSVHGEAGLRERLAIELAACPTADLARAADALALASRLHAPDRRQREPYVNPLLRVTIRILDHYRVRDIDVTCSALLHDSVEDHAADIAPGGRDAALGVLAARFGGRAAALVAAVTNPETSSGKMSTSSTASTSRPAWTPARGHG